MSIPVESTFIEFQRLGVLETRVRLLYGRKDKRGRQTGHKEIVKVLKILGLAEADRQVFFLGLGVTALGTQGLMIVYGIPEYQHTQVPA